MTDKIIETNSEQETRALGMELAGNARPGQIYALIGDLGVGKTVLTQGIAEGLGITEPVSSPTFTIVQVYEEGRMPFYRRRAGSEKRFGRLRRRNYRVG